MEAEGIPEGCAFIVALLCAPADAHAEERQENVFAVKKHAYGRKQGGQGHFGDDAARKAEKTAEQPAPP